MNHHQHRADGVPTSVFMIWFYDHRQSLCTVKFFCTHSNNDTRWSRDNRSRNAKARMRIKSYPPVVLLRWTRPPNLSTLKSITTHRVDRPINRDIHALSARDPVTCVCIDVKENDVKELMCKERNYVQYWSSIDRIKRGESKLPTDTRCDFL